MLSHVSIKSIIATKVWELIKMMKVSFYEINSFELETQKEVCECKWPYI